MRNTSQAATGNCIYRIIIEVNEMPALTRLTRNNTGCYVNKADRLLRPHMVHHLSLRGTLRDDMRWLETVDHLVAQFQVIRSRWMK